MPINRPHSFIGKGNTKAPLYQCYVRMALHIQAPHLKAIQIIEMTKWYLVILVLILHSQWLTAQIYVEKQTRHRFAQLNLGLDFQTSFGGEIKYMNPSGDLVSASMGNFYAPRLMIGGTHFWGHADFYLAIPVYTSVFKKDNQEVTALSGVETVFKFYPWRIEHNKLRPFIGVGLAPFFYEQENKNLNYGNGPELNHTSVPVYSGFTFNNQNHLLELGLMWNYRNKQSYHLSRDIEAEISTPPVYVNLSYRYMLETTASAEGSWESGRTEEVTQKLAAAKRLNNFYAGVGLSSAFWLKESSYNTTNRPYIEKYTTSIMPDFTIGYYIHKPDLNLALAYRGYSASTSTYGAIQEVKRRSLSFEATKFLFDYHGFVPFLGPCVSLEKLGFEESFEGQSTFDESSDKVAYGLVFGWDIRPNRLQSWILRTNLRWYPDLKLELNDGESIAFDNIEFNFIQLVVYPGRMIKRSPKPGN